MDKPDGEGGWNVPLTQPVDPRGKDATLGVDGQHHPVQDQPPPKPTAGAAIWDLVMADMAARDRTGRERYGTPLQANNGRDALVDAYQEALDLVVYLRQAIEERRGKGG